LGRLGQAGCSAREQAMKKNEGLQRTSGCWAACKNGPEVRKGENGKEEGFRYFEMGFNELKFKFKFEFHQTYSMH
jgi:hypothetical protein